MAYDHGAMATTTASRRQQSAFKSGTPARVHRNPFDDVLEQIDRAASVLHPDPDCLEPLRHPRRQVIVSVPVMMDHGHLRVFEGYRVVYKPKDLRVAATLSDSAAAASLLALRISPIVTRPPNAPAHSVP